jgi:hypothetical protein
LPILFIFTRRVWPPDNTRPADGKINSFVIIALNRWASRWFIGISSLLRTKAKDLAAFIPIRREPMSPGSVVTAILSISFNEIFA